MPIPVIATLDYHCVLLVEARDDGFDAVPYRRSSVDEGWVYRSLGLCFQARMNASGFAAATMRLN